MACDGIKNGQTLDNGWKVFESPTKGRGLVATRNFEVGEVLYQDKPILLGPRRKELCVGCHGIGPLTDCPNGCHLPVCAPECADSPIHAAECSFLRKSLPKDLDVASWRSDITCCIVVLRCLFLSQKEREFMKCLYGHRGKIHGFEAKVLKKYLGDSLSAEDEAWLHKCSEILDTNSFDVSNGQENSLSYTKDMISLRGVYHLAWLMNHDCSPNTCLSYSKEGTMYVSAAKPILEGEEITTIYCTLLWNTPTRRSYILETKHFLCVCNRCKDPTEFGANLSALTCPLGSGIMLPIAPLSPQSSWSCSCCAQILTSKQVTYLHMAQSVVMSRMDLSQPTSVKTFLTENEIIQNNSQIAITLKLEAIKKLGHVKGFTWEELSDEVLDLKESLCRDVLKTMNCLQIGYCRSKGLVLLELHCTLYEKLKRSRNNAKFKKVIWEELCSILAEAQKIFNVKETSPKCLDRQLNIHQSMAFEIESNLCS